jgi:hypothetical protein
MASSNGEMMGIDATVFFSSGGGVGATVEAARGRPTTAPCTPGVGARGGRRWLIGPCGWAGPAERPRPSGGGEGKSAGKKKDWAERPGGPKVTGRILFRIKFDFTIYQGFGNLHKEI